MHLSHGCFIKICIRYFGLSQVCSLAQKEFSHGNHAVTFKKVGFCVKLYYIFKTLTFFLLLKSVIGQKKKTNKQKMLKI